MEIFIEVEEIQGYLLILSPLAMSIVVMSIFTLQTDKNVKTYRLGEIAKDRNPTPKKQKGVFDIQSTVKYTEETIHERYITARSNWEDNNRNFSIAYAAYTNLDYKGYEDTIVVMENAMKSILQVWNFFRTIRSKRVAMQSETPIDKGQKAYVNCNMLVMDKRRRRHRP